MVEERVVEMGFETVVAMVVYLAAERVVEMVPTRAVVMVA